MRRERWRVEGGLKSQITNSGEEEMSREEVDGRGEIEIAY